MIRERSGARASFHSSRGVRRDSSRASPSGAGVRSAVRVPALVLCAIDAVSSSSPARWWRARLGLGPMPMLK